MEKEKKEKRENLGHATAVSPCFLDGSNFCAFALALIRCGSPLHKNPTIPAMPGLGSNVT